MSKKIQPEKNVHIIFRNNILKLYVDNVSNKTIKDFFILYISTKKTHTYIIA